MAKRDDTAPRKNSGTPPQPNEPARQTEDVVFPESFRKLWRNILGPWGRRR